MSPALTTAIERLLAKHKIVDVAGWLRVETGVLVSYVDVLDVYYRIAGTKLGRTRVRAPRPHMQMPDDFAENAAGVTSEVLAQRYGCNVETIARFRREAGIKAPRPTGNLKPRAKRPMPEGFATYAPTMNVMEIRAKTGASAEAVKRWLGEAGVTTRAMKHRSSISASPKGFVSRASERVHIECSRAGEAAEYLRRFGPVYRCKPTGAPDAKGSHWRRNNTVLTDEEIIERATSNGWAPDAWRQIAA